MKEREVTVHVFLGDAVGPDEGGQAADVPLEDALVDGEVQAAAREDDGVLVVVTDNRVGGRRVAVDVVCVELLLLLLLAGRGFQKSPVGSEVVTGTVRDGPVRGLLVGVHDVLIFVCFGVFLSHGADLLPRHCDHCDATWLTHSWYGYGDNKATIKTRLCIDGQVRRDSR